MALRKYSVTGQGKGNVSHHRGGCFGVLLFSLVIFFFSSITVVFAAPPDSSYAPGETLDPNCSPSTNNCTVNQIYYATSTGNYGIGTTSPFARFSIAGTSTAATALFAISTSSATATSTAFIVTGSGKVGIGTSTPTYALDVLGSISLTGTIYQNGTAINGSQWTTSGSNIYYSTGNVGVGTTSPYAKLSVQSSSGQIADIFAVASSSNSSSTPYFKISASGLVTLIGGVINPAFISETRGPTAGTSLDGAYAVFVQGNYAYVATQNRASLAVIAISSTTAGFVGETRGPSPGTSLAGAQGVFVSGNYAYVANFTRGSLAVIDVSNPSSPVYISETQGPVPGTSLAGADGVFVQGNYAYVANASRDSLAVIDISNPRSPTFVAETRGPTGGTSLNYASSVFVQGNYAYVTTNNNNSLVVIDISNPNNPLYIAETQGPVAGTSLSGAFSVFVSGNYAYVANAGRDSLAVIDISNPNLPTFIAETQGPVAGTSLDKAQGVFISGNYAYVAVGNRGSLAVINISDPANPTYVTETRGTTAGTTLAGAQGVFVSGNYAYVTSLTRDALSVIDVGGIDITNARIGGAKVGSLDVLNFSQFGQSLLVRGGLNVGQGAFVGGPLSISLASTSLTSTNTPLFSIKGTSTTPFLTVLSTGVVGIGTSSPYTGLSVSGSVAFGSTTVSVLTSTSTATSTFAGGATFATLGGNVGIGVTNPTHILEVGQSSATSTLVVSGTSDGGTGTYGYILGKSASTNNTAFIFGDAGSVDYGLASFFGSGTNYSRVGEFDFNDRDLPSDRRVAVFSADKDATNDYSLNFTTLGPSGFSANALAIKGNGNVLVGNSSAGGYKLGVGTTSPYASLSVGGNAVATNIYATSTLYVGDVTNGSYWKLLISGSNPAPEADFYYGGSRKSVFGYDPLVARSIFYNDTYVGGYYIFDSGGVAIGTDANTYANNALFVDQANNKVFTNSSVNFGVGTTSPYTKLSVSGATALGSTTVSVLTSTSTATSTFGGGINVSTGCFSIGNNCLTSSQWTTSGSNLYYTGGFLGVGTTSPLKAIDVLGSTISVSRSLGNAALYLMRIGDFAPGNFVGTVSLRGLNSAGVETQFTQINGLSVGITSGAETGAMSFRNIVGGVLTEVMRISSTSVGIGTTSPYATLSVSGQIVAASFVSTTTATSTFFGGANFALSAGNIGIGTSTPAAKLNVIGALCVDDSTPTCGNAARADGTIYSVAALSASLDLAEAYPTKDITLEPGDIVMDDLSNTFFMSKATRASSLPVIGIVSTNPGFYLGGFNDDMFKDDKKLPIALAGRVPLKVNLEGGPIHPGDWITLSSTQGIGMKATTSGEMVGIALESFDGANGSTTTKIETFVKVGYHEIPHTLPLLSSSPFTLTSEMTNVINSMITTALSSIHEWVGEKITVVTGVFDSLSSKEIYTSKLCLEDVCITKTELKALLQNAGLNSPTPISPTSSSSSPLTPLPSSLNPDSTPPTITIIGNNPATVNKGTPYIDLGATVDDNIDHNLAVHVSGDSIDTSIPGTYTVIYTATDNAGNTASTTRTVIVTDSTPSLSVSTSTPQEGTSTSP